jgi:hypothetical protein
MGIARPSPSRLFSKSPAVRPRRLHSSLAAKLYEDFRPGVRQLQNSNGPINDAKIVVCLDSLYRVVTGTLTSFVVDEAVASSCTSTPYADGEEDSEFMVDGNPSSGEDDLLVAGRLDATFIKNIVPFLRHQVVCAHLDPTVTCARPTGATITVRRAFGGIIGEVCSTPRHQGP